MENKTIEQTLDDIIAGALVMRASDIHIDPGESALVIMFRIDGSLHMREELSLSLHEGIILRIKVLARLPIDDKRLPKDGRFKWENKDGNLTAEVRVSMMPTSYGENAVLRIFDPLISIFSLKELGFSDTHAFSLERALAFHSGLVMVVGPTGSGKTTTLYSMLAHIKKSSRLIVTIEDPIERRIGGVRQIEVGKSSLLEYVTVLRSVLRQDPDVIMIGEIRDRESAELAIQCALTGHLVITTLHASSVFQIKKRLINMGISEYLIDATLICALSQRLVGKICVHCKVEDTDRFEYEKWIDEESSLQFPEEIYKGRGCDECGGSGRAGRMVVSEFLSEGTPLHVDAAHKASLGLISFPEVIWTHNEYRHDVQK